jgi:hypothetical protein
VDWRAGRGAGSVRRVRRKAVYSEATTEIYEIRSYIRGAHRCKLSKLRQALCGDNCLLTKILRVLMGGNGKSSRLKALNSGKVIGLPS